MSDIISTTTPSSTTLTEAERNLLAALRQVGATDRDMFWATALAYGMLGLKMPSA